MKSSQPTLIRDARPLYAGARSLLGYFLYTAFEQYLGVVLGNIVRWRGAGLVDDDGHASPAFRRTACDFNALDRDTLADLCGTYFFLQSSHKQANHRLMHDRRSPRVLYLRGYEYEAAVAVTGRLALGVSTLDTTAFNQRLASLLGREFSVFKVMSPKDLYWETIDAQRHYYDDYDQLVRATNLPIASVYLNAACWKDDLAWLAQRMDHFVVYVSSITESAMWEIQHLADTGCAPRTTIVFDRAAILTKNLHAGLYHDLPGLALGDVRWAPARERHPEVDVDALRASLATRFTVIDADVLDASAASLSVRIRAGTAPASADARTAPLPFRFRPSLDDTTLAQLGTWNTALWDEIDPAGGQPLDCLPMRINQVLLRVCLALLLGEHRQAGCALAVYVGQMKALLDFYTAAGHIDAQLPASETPRHLALLAGHRDTATEIAWAFLCSGQSDDFGDHTTEAEVDLDRISEAARTQAAACLRA